MDNFEDHIKKIKVEEVKITADKCCLDLELGVKDFNEVIEKETQKAVMKDTELKPILKSFGIEVLE